MSVYKSQRSRNILTLTGLCWRGWKYICLQLGPLIKRAWRREIDVCIPEFYPTRREQDAVFKYSSYFLVHRSATTETKRARRKRCSLCVTFLSKTDIAFLTSDSKFHNFGVTLPLPSFPDWLTAFNREETVSHVNVVALLSSHGNGADYYWGLLRSSRAAVLNSVSSFLYICAPCTWLIEFLFRKFIQSRWTESATGFILCSHCSSGTCAGRKWVSYERVREGLLETK